MNTLWNNLDADAKGEYLRKQFFLCDNKGGLGCYTSFKLAPDVVKLPDEPDDGCDEIIYTCAKKNIPEVCSGEIVMKYYWDGDGTLMFFLPNGTILENTDCKKTRGWIEESNSFADWIYTQEEVQKLVTRAFVLGCESVDSDWGVDRACSRLEEQIKKKMENKLKKFTEETGFVL